MVVGWGGSNCLSVFMYVCLSVFAWMTDWLTDCLSSSLSVILSVCLSLSDWLSVCLSVSVSLHTHLHLFNDPLVINNEKNAMLKLSSYCYTFLAVTIPAIGQAFEHEQSHTHTFGQARRIVPSETLAMKNYGTVVKQPKSLIYWVKEWIIYISTKNTIACVCVCHEEFETARKLLKLTLKQQWKTLWSVQWKHFYDSIQLAITYGTSSLLLISVVRSLSRGGGTKVVWSCISGDFMMGSRSKKCE